MTRPCDVDVWLVSLLGEASADALSEDEINRAARFRFDSDRARWIRARSALRTILAKYLGIPAAQIRFTLGPYGKPAIPEYPVEFSLSHAGDWAMIAVTEGVPVGVDIERIRENVNMAAILQRVGEVSIPATQAARFSAWTRRESLTKAVGGALLETPAGDLRTCILDAPEGYCASLALLGQEPQIRRYSTVPEDAQTFL